MIIFLALLGCKKENLTDLEKGQRVYKMRCVQCHNFNPKIAGSLGPDIYGSSFELLTLKIKAQKYPNGYTPKRNTNQMMKLPLTDGDIRSLHIFLNQ